MQSVAKVLIGWPFIYVWSGSILLMFLYFIRKLWTSTHRLQYEVSAALSQLESLGGTDRKRKFAQEIDGLNKSIHETTERTTAFQQSWNDFYQEVIFHPSPDAPRLIMHTGTSHQFFDPQALLTKNANVPLLMSVSNLLTGLGILGTFLGLFGGVYLASYGMSASDIDKVKQALGELLGGASTAFITSILGLFFSMIFTYVRGRRMGRLLSTLEHWNSKLDHLIEHVTIEKTSEEQLIELRKISKNRQDLNEDVLLKVVEQFNKVLSDNTLGQFQDFARSMQTMNRSLQTNVESLAAQHQNLQQMSAQVSGQIQSTLQQSVQAIEQTFQHAAQNVSNATRATLKQVVDSLAEEIHALWQTLQTTSQQMKQGGHTFQQAALHADKVREGLQTLLNNQQELIQALFQIPSMTQTFTDASQSLEQAHHQTHAMSRNNAELVEKLHTILSQLENSQQHIHTIWQNYQDRFEHVDQSLGGAFQEIQTGVTGYATQLSQYTQTMDNNLAKSVGVLSGVVEELRAMMDEMPSTTARRSRR